MTCLTGNILPFWLQHMQDHNRGGWYGRMTGRGQLMKDAPRGAVLYARLLWTFSAASRVLHDSRYLQAATMTKDYILAHFLDREHGGAYWSISADGQPLDTKKQFYAQGFMLYGFSEYARAAANFDDAAVRAAGTEALEVALQLFDIIERHAWDPVYGGYIEACTRDWQPIADMRLSDKDENYPKSQNTHLHIIEPYTNLLKAPAPVPAAVAAAVERLIGLFTDKILSPETHHLDLFFDMDWTRMSTAASCGHDIECSWLLHEAALALGDEAILNKVEPVVRQVAQASEEGPTGGEAVWWVQAETVVGYMNLYQHFGDEAALQKALSTWEFIKTHLIDHEHGEWFWSVSADGTPNLDDDHAGFWKCPYHNSRMCLEIIERTSAHT